MSHSGLNLSSSFTSIVNLHYECTADQCEQRQHPGYHHDDRMPREVF